MPSSLRRALTDRAALGVFAFLAATWFLPRVVDSVGLLRPLLPLTWALVLPSYLLMLLVYDGLLEAPAYPIADALPVGGEFVWEAGLLLVYYAFAVLAVALGRTMAARYRPDAGEWRTVGSGLLVALGVVLLVGGVVLATTVPFTEAHVCTGSQSSSGAVSERCYTETSFNTVPYGLMGGGLGLGALGGIVLLGVDRLRDRIAPA